MIRSGACGCQAFSASSDTHQSPRIGLRCAPGIGRFVCSSGWLIDVPRTQTLIRWSMFFLGGLVVGRLAGAGLGGHDGLWGGGGHWWCRPEGSTGDAYFLIACSVFFLVSWLGWCRACMARIAVCCVWSRPWFRIDFVLAPSWPWIYSPRSGMTRPVGAGRHPVAY